MPAGPFGPGVFVPPPRNYFERHSNKTSSNIKIAHQLLRPPFNLPDYYDSLQRPTPRPARPARPIIFPGASSDRLPSTTAGAAANNKKTDVWQTSPLSSSAPHRQAEPAAAPYYVPPIPQHVKVVPGQGPTFSATPYGAIQGQPAVSLHSDIRVNHQQPLPEINVDSEIFDPQRLSNVNKTSRTPPLTATATFEQQPVAARDAPPAPPVSAFVSVYRVAGGSYAYNLSGRL